MAQSDRRAAADHFNTLTRRVRRFIGRLSAVVEGLETLDVELRALGTAARQGDTADATSLLAAVRKHDRADAALKRAAIGGVVSVELKRRSNRYGLAVIDGRRMSLPPRLADLLAVLTAQASITDDFVPFKELSARMEAKGGVPLSRRARAQLMFRLREEFLAAGLSSYLIVSHPRRGVRLAVRRPGPRPPQGDRIQSNPEE